MRLPTAPLIPGVAGATQGISNEQCSGPHVERHLQAPADGVQQHDQRDDQHGDDGDGETQVRRDGLVPVRLSQRGVAATVTLIDVAVPA